MTWSTCGPKIPLRPVASIRVSPAAGRANTVGLNYQRFSTATRSQNKGLIKDVLASTASKRDAKSYLKNFVKRPSKRSSQHEEPQSSRIRVNLGRLYSDSERLGPAQSKTTSVFEPPAYQVHDKVQILHVAIVKIRAPQSINDEDLQSIARTITQLATLGMQSIVVVDPHEQGLPSTKVNFAHMNQEMSRVIDALHLAGDVESNENPRAQRVDYLFDGLSGASQTTDTETQAGAQALTVANKDRLCSPLGRGLVPVLGSFGTTIDDQLEHSRLDANSMILELVKALQGEAIQHITRDQDIIEGLSGVESQQRAISIDRIILLDPFGGIPSAERAHAPHVYVNLKQEYTDIVAQTKAYPHSRLSRQEKAIHLDNLHLLNAALKILPDSSSGLIVTPEEVARSHGQTHEESGPRVQTRAKRNPLIHNLLTDKPSISSSLPYGRSSGLGYGGPTSTFLKRGMALTTIPDVFNDRWIPPSKGGPFNMLDDPLIDQPKLVRLIEASFGKTLDVTRFLARVQDRFAGLVVAGDYEGCALFTWESTPSVPGLTIPYLDKFAVLPQSQGTGASVADILFTCMIMDCFPNGVCWRSRATNPVNKWYFERAKGAWRIPGSDWTSFWTTDQPSLDELKAYEAICKDIPPTWPP